MTRRQEKQRLARRATGVSSDQWPGLLGTAPAGQSSVDSQPGRALAAGVRLADLDQAAAEVVHVFGETEFRPHPVRMSKLLLEPACYVISAAKLKTHDRVVATLSLRNIDNQLIWMQPPQPL